MTYSSLRPQLRQALPFKMSAGSRFPAAAPQWRRAFSLLHKVPPVIIFVTFAVFLHLLASASPVAAQRLNNNEQSRYAQASIYRYADTDEVTIQVNVWGTVNNPGIYEMPRGADLNMLFSAAGGPRLGVRERVDEQTIIVKLTRQTDSGKRTIYEQVMEDEIVIPDENPTLQDGDVLTVESYVVQGVDWRGVLSIGSSLITLGITLLNTFVLN